MSYKTPHSLHYITAACPECGGLVPFANHPSLNKLVQCLHCHEMLVVSNVQPLTLHWALDIPLDVMSDDAEHEPDE